MINVDDLSTKDESGYLHKILLSKHDQKNIFLGALFVIFVQLSMLWILFDIIFAEDFHIIPAENYLIVIPRVLSSLMMHINVESDFRNGMFIMKYVVNHP